MNYKEALHKCIDGGKVRRVEWRKNRANAYVCFEGENFMLCIDDIKEKYRLGAEDNNWEEYSPLPMFQPQELAILCHFNGRPRLEIGREFVIIQQNMDFGRKYQVLFGNGKGLLVDAGDLLPYTGGKA